MISRLIFAFTLLFSFAVAQDLKETHGKTHSQILAMGYDKWYDFYTGKEGETTQGMARAGYTFAESLKWRNLQLEAKKPAKFRAQIKTLRTQFDKLGTASISIYRALSGGGTLWQLTYSTDAMNQEETLYALLGGKVKPSKPQVVSKVTKEIAALKAAVKSPDPTWSHEFPRAETNKYLADIDSSWKQILAIAKTLDRPKSDHILAYCVSAIKDYGEQG